MRRFSISLNNILNHKYVHHCPEGRLHQRSYCQQKELANTIFSAEYCRTLVEKNDHENYLCTLLLKGDQRRHAFALRAFNVEVAKCCQLITEDHIGRMKLQFWYDSVDKCYEPVQSYVSDHPVLRELKHTIYCNKLSKLYLKRLVIARDRPLIEQFLSIKELEDYAEQSFSSLNYLLVEMCGVADINVDHALSHLGKAQGIATLLRAIPFTGRSHALSIPQETLIKHGVSQERVMRDMHSDKGVEECVFEIATLAHQHLEQARQLSKKIPRHLKKLFLPAVAVDRYLERLRKANFRLSDQSCIERDTMLPMSIYWHNFRGKF